MAEEIDLGKCDFRNFRSSVTLALMGQGHTCAHMWLRSTHTLNYIEIGKSFCRWTYGQTDEHTRL